MDEEVKPYTKPSVISRLCSGLVDLLLSVGVIIGLYYIVISTPLGNNLKSYQANMSEIQERYTYLDKETNTSTIYKMNEWKEEDQTAYKDSRFKYTLNQYVYMMSSALISESIFYFLIPLLNKRRASLGMMLAGEDLLAVKYYGEPKWYHLLGRLSIIFFLGTALPYYLLSDLTIFIIPAITMSVALINSKTNRTIHDLLTGTIVVMNEKTLQKLNERAEMRRLTLEEKNNNSN